MVCHPNLTSKIKKVGFLDFSWIFVGLLDRIGFLDFSWIFVGLLDRIGFFRSIQSNNPTKIQLFWIFKVGFGWMFNNSSNPKSRKKLTSYLHTSLNLF
jgi:hypothetical protein